MGLVTAWTESEIGVLFVLCGVFVLLVQAPPQRLLGLAGSRKAFWSAPWPILLLTGMGATATFPVLLDILWFFTKAGAFVFGSGLAIVPFLHGGVVDDFHWLTERQFLDAVAVAMITPGPVVITVAFIGYLVGGPLGATLAALGVFLPCYLFVVIPAPYYERYATRKGIADFVAGVTAAATGAIAGAAFVLGRRTLVDVTTIVICAVVFIVISLTKKIPEPVLIVAAAIAGLVLR